MSSKVKPSGWRGEPLPRGRHRLAPEAVRASQRERLVRAMLETVAERGYDATTVPDVVARARVSRNAFYEFFDDKTDCFIAACDEAGQEMLSQLVALASEPDWLHALQRGMGEYLGWWRARPAFARAYFVGLPGAGERAVAQRDRQYGFFRAMFADLGRRARAEQPELAPLPDVVPRILVLAVTEVLAEEVRAGRGERLAELQPELVEVAVRLLADDATAERLRSS